MKAYELELDINTDVNKTYEQAINKRKLNIRYIEFITIKQYVCAF